MNYQFRNEVAGMKKAAMGEMFQLAKESMDDKGKLIDFASGHPATEVFQDKLIRKYINMAVEKSDEAHFEYDIQGYEPLIYALKGFVNQKGNTIKTEDDLLITYGSTESAYLAASALVGYGEKVVVEVPSYVNAIKSFQLLGGEIIGVHMEEDGVNIEELENIMKCGGVSLFYTIPNFGNPSGITMSLKKRKAVYELARKYHVPILEDNIYGELRYRGERLPNIKDFDTEGMVVYIGSISKVIAPAMRIGCTKIFDEIEVEKYSVILATDRNELYDELLQKLLFKKFNMEQIYTFVCNTDGSLQNNRYKREAYCNQVITKIGKHSYGPICVEHHPLIEEIGAFCCFAAGVEVVSNHEMKYITTHDILYSGKQYIGIDIPYEYYKGEVYYLEGTEPKDCVTRRKKNRIGNDVWLGRNVIITNGACIGNGVIAGAGAVITKDVPDYAVVVGVPAKIIKYRYSQSQIEALNRIQWWNWSDDKIRDCFDDFYLPIEEFIKKYDKKG